MAALRGHNVTLYEKRDTLGFMLDFAESVKGPHENLGDLKNYLIRQLELAGVTVMTVVEVDADLVVSEAPDAVIVAVGGIRGTELAEAIGDKAVVIGDAANPYNIALAIRGGSDAGRAV